MRLDSGRIVRNVICLVSLLAFVTTPLAAQRGIDLLDPEQVLPAGTERVEARGGTSTARIRLVDPPEGVSQATHGTTEYQYDDGVFENFPEDSRTTLTQFEYEYAQKFDLERSGDLVSVSACFLRPETDRGRQVFFDLHFYDDDDGEPDREDPLRYSIEGDIRRPGQDACITVAGVLAGKPFSRGEHWVGIRWQSNTNKILGIDSYTEDDPRPREEDVLGSPYEDATEVRTRSRDELGLWSAWMNPRTSLPNTIKAYGIRIVVDHRPHDPEPDPTPDPGPTPDPEPEPEDNVPPGPLTFPPTGPGYTDCIPTVSRLVFDGDYRVSLCYETPDGTKGEASAGIYKSSKSGLLWFFDNENAEVLVKVLDGCAQTGHRWVFMAAATDLAFNLYVTDGKRETWSYHNMQGQPAETQANNMALRCAP